MHLEGKELFVSISVLEKKQERDGMGPLAQHSSKLLTFFNIFFYCSIEDLQVKISEAIGVDVREQELLTASGQAVKPKTLVVECIKSDQVRKSEVFLGVLLFVFFVLGCFVFVLFFSVLFSLDVLLLLQKNQSL